jgi:hypothetical protein
MRTDDCHYYHDTESSSFVALMRRQFPRYSFRIWGGKNSKFRRRAKRKDETEIGAHTPLFNSPSTKNYNPDHEDSISDIASFVAINRQQLDW